MTVESVSVDGMNISPVCRLDRIHAFWVDVRPGAGHVTLICYGSAWTAYFGGMGNRTIQQFFAEADTGYLVNKMGITPHLKGTKRDHAYLGRIIDAVKCALQSLEQGSRMATAAGGG